ncbi:uncharacterized protein V1513DRAFT_438324, partial [Lipomyces chichibuensis]|uniref:uncharacterized protein n=1 Tax=Lipomyces chichibuensis TaxID=1546026 RepID=UPI003343BA6D
MPICFKFDIFLYYCRNPNMSSRRRSRSPDMRDHDRDRDRERHRDRDRDRERDREGYSLSRQHKSSHFHHSSSKGYQDSASSSHRHRTSKHESSHPSSDRERDRDRVRDRDRDRRRYTDRDRDREFTSSDRHRYGDRENRSRDDHDRYTRRDRDRNGKDSVKNRDLQLPVADLERNILLSEDQEADLGKGPPSSSVNPEDNPDVVDSEAEEQRKERERRERDARAQALTLEIIGDLPYAEVKPPENVLFVCKLNPITEDEDLHTFFSQCGKILSCEVVRDKKTGKSLQYAFIEYEQKSDCENAYLKMQGALIDDCRIHVDFSQSVAKLSNMWRDATNRKRAQEAREMAKKPKRRWRD